MNGALLRIAAAIFVLIHGVASAASPQGAMSNLMARLLSLAGKLLVAGALVLPPASAGAWSPLDAFNGFSDFLGEITGSYEAKAERVRGTIKHSVDANERYFAFSVILSTENPDEHIGLAVFEFETGEWTVLKSADPAIAFAGPRFSTSDPNVLYFQEDDLRFPKSTTTKRCEIRPVRCVDIMTLNGNIRSPVEVPEGLLFVHSPPHERFEEFGYAEHDLYLRNHEGKIERLSNMRFFLLDNLNVLPDRIIAQMFGPTKEAQQRIGVTWPTLDIRKPRTDVWQLDHSGSLRELQFRASTLHPLGLLEGLSTAPSAHPGSPLLAFMNRPGGRRYNLAIENMMTGERRYIRAETQNMSHPIVVDEDRVLYSEQDGGIYSVKRYSFKKSESELLINVSEAALQSKQSIIIEKGDQNSR